MFSNCCFVFLTDITRWLQVIDSNIRFRPEAAFLRDEWPYSFHY